MINNKNPSKALQDQKCEWCDEVIREGEKVFNNDIGEDICLTCAKNSHHVCECGDYKMAEHEFCYGCATS